MASLNTELALVKRFHMLSKSYDNRPVIARRNTLPALVRFIASNDRETRHYALAALHLLAQHPENMELLCEERGLVRGVFVLCKDAAYDDPEMHTLANNVLDALAPVLQGRDPRREEFNRVNTTGSSGASPGAGNNNTNNNNNRTGASGSEQLDTSSLGNESFSTTRRGRAARVVRGVGSDAIHTVVLDIPALDPRSGEDLALIEDIFQTTRGVLSYSVFLESQQARLFMTCEAQAVQQVLLEAGFESVVVRDEVVGQELFSNSSSTDVNDGRGGNNYNTHSYFDAGSSQQRPSYLQSFASSIYKTALVLRGGNNYNSDDDSNSLSARVQQQRERERQGNGNSTLSYVTKTLSKWW